MIVKYGRFDIQEIRWSTTNEWASAMRSICNKELESNPTRTSSRYAKIGTFFEKVGTVPQQIRRTSKRNRLFPFFGKAGTRTVSYHYNSFALSYELIFAFLITWIISSNYKSNSIRVLPPEVGLLKSLKTIDLRFNMLFNTQPSEISSEAMDTSSRHTFSPFPKEMEKLCSSLQVLEVSG